MKNFFTCYFFSILLVIISFPVEIMARDVSSTYHITLHKQPIHNVDREWDVDCEGNRAPSRPIYCSISRINGIEINAIDKNDIELFEIYRDGICILSSSEEKDFINILFSTSESFEVRLISTNYAFIGYI